MKASEKNLIESLIIKAIKNLLPMQIAAGVNPYQRVRNHVALFNIVTSSLIMPASIHEGVTVHEIMRRLTAAGFHFTRDHLNQVLKRAVREEVIRFAQGPKNGKRGRNPRVYAIN